MAQETMNFVIPQVDEKATRTAAKKAFVTYHQYKATLETLYQAHGILKHFRGSAPTAGKTMRYVENDADAIHGSSKRLPAIKQFENAMADIQRQREQLEKRREQIEAMESFITLLDNAVAGLPEYERQIMDKTFMVDKWSRKKDKDLLDELPFGRTEYYEHKEKAMLRIAFALCIEVYEQVESAA
jgi:ArpU family phage transcriptional regulator